MSASVATPSSRVQAPTVLSPLGPCSTSSAHDTGERCSSSKQPPKSKIWEGALGTQHKSRHISLGSDRRQTEGTTWTAAGSIPALSLFQTQPWTHWTTCEARASTERSAPAPAPTISRRARSAAGHTPTSRVTSDGVGTAGGTSNACLTSPNVSSAGRRAHAMSLSSTFRVGCAARGVRPNGWLSMSEYRAECLACMWTVSGSFANTNQLLMKHREGTDHAIRMGPVEQTHE